MKRVFATRATVLAIALCAAAGAQAQIRSTDHYVGGAIGHTDLGTGLRLFGGGTLTKVFGWEAQLSSYGSKTYQQGAYTFKDSAWGLGAYGTASFPVANNVTVFGKAGAHYLKGKHAGPFASESDGSVEFGIGAGVKWQFNPKAALRADFENIGGSGGDLLTVGIQFGL